MAKTTQESVRVPDDVLAKYEPVIGLEVHLQLKTASKVFCPCSTRFGDPPNTNVCPVCLGLPGTLPVLNKRAVELAIRASLAIGCTVHPRSQFARKNYFYPDLPKGYQISMYELPLATNGALEIQHDGQTKRIGITRLHMEEDAAKAMHEGFPDSTEKTYVDYNRCGVPLVEIVSEPDMRSAEEGYEYLTTLKQVLQYADISDCDMEKGSLRCDGNVSVRLRGAREFGAKVEVKNLNSFRYVARAIEHEIERQIEALEAGERISQETRLWNVAAGRTEPMRSKEFAHDYRYFPEPDLLPVTINETWKSEILAKMPELPAARRARFLRDYGITPYDAGVLTATQALADYFEAVVKSGGNAKTASNWMQTELLRRLNDAGREISDSSVSAAALAELLKIVEGGQITAAVGKKVLEKMFATGESPASIIASEGLGQKTNTGAIEAAALEVIQKNPDNVAKYRAGNEGVFKFFVGQVMRMTKGQADPQAVNEIVKRLLG
ncbi:MAG: Asp-tRNA(Asn)/Glu-tRNA(Gln) amidotransferase subunit GatB [Acidobacteria bacterium]|nr:Asp-tRNA(Asn)/Glu-tRNA(Gln) amidotransferase subunit GatB [Acidobacteriota bacterium]